MVDEQAEASSYEALGLDWISLLADHTFATVLVPVDKEFLGYLAQDQIFAGGHLPKSSLADADEDGEEYEGRDDWETRDNLFDPSKQFPAVHTEILDALRRFPQGCLPKLDGCSPKDAIWISTEHSLRCTNAAEIYEILKASDRVAVNINKASYLVLRQWKLNWEPSLEFRIFVHHGRIVAGCQRDDTVFYDHLSTMRSSVTQTIDDFFSSVLSRRIVPCCPSFVIDLYLGSGGPPMVVDVDRWDRRETSAILFTWEELDTFATSKDSPTWPLRFINSQGDCRLGYCRYNTLPIDLNQLPI